MPVNKSTSLSKFIVIVVASCLTQCLNKTR